MRSLYLVLLLVGSVSVWAQNSTPSSASNSSNSPAQDSASSPSKPAANPGPNLPPPRSDHVDAASLDDEPGQSSSKETQIDISPPEDDAGTHPRSSQVVSDAEFEGGDINEMHPWDPHKAAKDIEVGDFYFKKKNYIAAESRYREALFYKDNDATATFKLAVCLEKMARSDEARSEYESYLKILPYGPQAPDAKKALDRLKNAAANPGPN